MNKIKLSDGTVMNLKGNQYRSDTGNTISKTEMESLIQEGRVELMLDDTNDLFDGLTIPEEHKEVFEKVFNETVSQKSNDIKESIEIEYKDKLDSVVEKLESKYKDKLGSVSEKLESKYKDKLDSVVEEFNDKKLKDVKENYSDEVERIQETLDVYLNDLHQEWKEENKVELQNESIVNNAKVIINQLTKVLSENNVNLPIDKVDMYEEELNRNDKLENKLNEVMKSKSRIKDELLEVRKEVIINELSDELSYSDEVKFNELCEEIVEFVDLEDFGDKAKLVKNRYFSESARSATRRERPVERKTKRKQIMNNDMSMFVSSLNKQ
jgi:hypothetical protein